MDIAKDPCNRESMDKCEGSKRKVSNCSKVCDSSDAASALVSSKRLQKASMFLDK